MNAEFTVFSVDDIKTNRQLIEATFKNTYSVESFESGKACIARLEEKVPDIFLLDVDMPEMDGYTLCRHLRAEPATSTVPIIFISAYDDLESRLTGYDAGGDDFIGKPFKLPELKQKVEVLRRISNQNADIKNKLDEADMLTGLILSNLDEYAVLLKLLRSLNSCTNYHDIADATLGMLRSYQLDGALQYRLSGFELTINSAGEARPLEASIINQVRTQGTIVEFKNRAAFNFERVSILINNMPVSDPDLCGRLRDHLAIAVETVDAKLLAMQNQLENADTKGEISSLLKELDATVHSFSERYKMARDRGSETTQSLLSELDSEFSHLGMRETQEEGIRQIVKSSTNKLVDIFDFSADTEETLKDLSARLSRALGPANQR